MTTQKKLIWDSGESENVYRQCTVVTAGGKPIGKPYYFKELMKGDVGISLQVDLGKVLQEGLTDKQRITLHSILLKMVFNALTHTRLMIDPSNGVTSASSELQPAPAIIKSGEEMPSSGVVGLFDQITDDTVEAVQYLFQCGHIAEEELAIAISYANEHSISVLEAIERLKYASQVHVAQAKAEKFHVPFVDLDNTEIDPKVIASVSKNIVIGHNVIPIYRKRDVLVVASANPLDFYSLDNLRSILNCEVEYALATMSALDAAIVRYYGQPLKPQVIEDEDYEFLHEAAVTQELDPLLSAVDELNRVDSLLDRDHAANSTAIVKLVDLVLLQSIKAKATQLVVSAEEESCVIHMAIEETLYYMPSPPAHLGQAFIDRLKRMAGIPLDVGNRQKVGIDLHVGGRLVRLEAGFIPLAHGECAILNVSYPSSPRKDGDEEGEGPAPVGAKT